jgi:hypothetical protein
MRIVLLPSIVNGVIAWEEQLDKKEGEFVVGENGAVIYRNANDPRVWFCGISIEQFRTLAAAWNRYSEAVLGLPDRQQLAKVERLRLELTRHGALVEQANCFWNILVEQAQDGLL